MTAALVTGATRSRERDLLRRMMMVSSAAHAAAIAALVTASWGLRPQPPADATAISVPGAPGALWTDLLAPSGPEPKPQAMVESVTRPTLKPAVPRRSSSTKPAPPATGPEVDSASSPAGADPSPTEGRLSTPVLPGMNARLADVDFCDPLYLGQMVASIHRNWQRNQHVAGRPIVRFVIQRDGTLSGITLRQPSGYPGLDLEALRAVTLTRAIPPLPACYPHPHYAMNLTFEYTR